MIKIRFFEEGSPACLFESPVLSAQIPFTLNKSEEWSVQIPLLEESYSIITEGLDVSIYDGSRYMTGGTIQKISVKFDGSPAIEIKGRQDLDSLYDLEGDSLLYPNNQNHFLQLFKILASAGWRFGDYRDIDRTRTVTVDLRTDRQKITQFANLLKQDGSLKYRFGGYDYSGQPLIDVGKFDEIYRHVVLNPSYGEQKASVALSDTGVTSDYTTRLYATIGLGGSYNYLVAGETTPRQGRLNSGGALDANPALAYDPNYPIYEEVVSSSYPIIPTAAGAIGGRQYSYRDSTSGVGVNLIGDTSGAGTINRWASYVFKPPPGRLSEVSIWLGTVTGEATLKASYTFAWELCQVNEASPQTPGTLIQTGIIDPSNWTAGTRMRITFPNPAVVTYDKRLMFRLGFTTQVATGLLVRPLANATNSARTMRVDYSGARTSGYTSLNYQPCFEAITTPIDAPKGRRTILENPRLIPQQANSDYSTTTEIRTAAVDLYNWCVLQLKNGLTPLTDAPISVLGYNPDWKPGDKVQIQSQIQFPGGAKMESFTRVIESVSFNYTDQQKKMDVKFLPSTVPEFDNDIRVAQYDAAQKDRDQRTGLYAPDFKEWELTELTSTIQYKNADTTLSDGTPAVTVVFAVPVPPTGKYETSLMGTPYGIHSTQNVPILCEVVSKPPNGLICKFAKRDIGWGIYDSATVYAHIAWR